MSHYNQMALEALEIAALRARRWPGDWDIPELAFGGRIEEQGVREAVEKAANRKHRPPCDTA